MAKLDTDYGSFKDLISVAKVYTVPQYQRRYSWKPKQQVAELWSDVVRLYRERSATGVVESTHFIGSVVVGETESRALGPGECSVIDGQQRLTTLGLILCAIRDTLVDDEAAKAQITTNYLTFPDTRDTRLVLSQADSETYQSIVLEEAVADRKSPVYRAYNYVRRELLAGLVEDADPDEVTDEEAEEVEEVETEDVLAETTDDEILDSEALSVPWNWEVLLAVLSQDLELVSISGVPAERAYQIFATLNHAGLKLTQVDLIRNAVFMHLPETNKEAYKGVWQPLESRLGERGLGKFLHTWVVRQGHSVPQKDTYASVLHELKIAGPNEDKIYSLLKAISSEASEYLLVSDPGSYDSGKLGKEWKVPDGIVRSLGFLADWGNVPAQPLIMEILTRWRAKRLNAPATARLLRALESVLVRRFIALIPPNDLRSTLSRLVLQVANKPDAEFEKAVLAALREPTRRWPSDAEIDDAMVTKPLYRPKNISQTFLILKRIAEYMEGKECPYIELGTSASKYSVEHILPQTPEGTSWFKDLESWGDIDAHVTWNTRRHTAGNLTLTAYNAELSNRSFDEKKTWIDEKLRLQLSTRILEQDSWAKKQIENRSAELALVAQEIWPRE